MKNIMTHFDRLMAAITFAEANEPEIALEFRGGHKPGRITPAQATKMTGSNVLTNQAAH